jgi:hypothetical protein
VHSISSIYKILKAIITSSIHRDESISYMALLYHLYSMNFALINVLRMLFTNFHFILTQKRNFLALIKRNIYLLYSFDYAPNDFISINISRCFKKIIDFISINYRVVILFA